MDSKDDYVFHKDGMQDSRKRLIPKFLLILKQQIPLSVFSMLPPFPSL